MQPADMTDGGCNPVSGRIGAVPRNQPGDMAMRRAMLPW